MCRGEASARCPEAGSEAGLDRELIHVVTRFSSCLAGAYEDVPLEG